MRLSKTALVCAAAFGAFALAAQAQAQAQTSSSGMATQTPSHADTQKMTGDKAKADADYKAAQQACNMKSGTAKDECLKEAKAAHDRALGDKESSMSHSPGTMGSAPGTTNGAYAGSSQGSASGTGYSSSTTPSGSGKK